MPNLATWLKSSDNPASHTDKRLANRFLRYWDDLRHNRSYPLIADLNLDEIREFAPYTFNLDLSEGIDNPKFRFIGRALVRDCGGDLTNKDVSTLPLQSLLARVVLHRGEVAAEGKPFIAADEFVNAEGNRVLYRAVMLPFSNNGNAVEYIVGAVISKIVRATASEHTAKETNEVTIQSLMESLGAMK